MPLIPPFHPLLKNLEKEKAKIIAIHAFTAF
jgi:hypothetical protein